MTSLPPLFASFDSNAPCGRDMEYSPEFLALQQAAVGRPEQQYGSTIIPAESPDWQEVERNARALCQQTCDVRVLTLLTQAWTEQRGVAGYAEGVALVAELLESRWNEVYPALYLEDERDPMPRMNALVALGEPAGMGRAVREACLLDGMHGQLTLRQAEALLDGSQTDDGAYPGGRTRLQDALRHAFRVGTESVVAVVRALDALQRIRECAARELGSEWTPDYSSLERSLSLVAALGRETQAEAASKKEDTQDIGLTTPAEPSVGQDIATAWRDLAIESRDDALLALEKVCRYFDMHEPSHPAPLLIRRVQQTVPLNFHELLQDLAPQGVDQFTLWMPRGE